jgi:hypothetical protein
VLHPDIDTPVLHRQLRPTDRPGRNDAQQLLIPFDVAHREVLRWKAFRVRPHSATATAANGFLDPPAPHALEHRPDGVIDERRIVAARG